MVSMAPKCADKADANNVEESGLTCGKVYVTPFEGVLPVVVVEVNFPFERDVGFAFVVDLVSTRHEGTSTSIAGVGSTGLVEWGH